MSNAGGRSGIARPGGGIPRPGSGIPQPGTSRIQRPSTGIPAPPTSGIQRPGSGIPSGIRAPSSGIQRPGSGIQRPGSGIQRPGSGIQRPGTARTGPPMGQPRVTVTEDRDPADGDQTRRSGIQKSTGKKKESLLRWFDKNVEKNLASHRTRTVIPPPELARTRGLRHPLVVGSSASGIDVSSRLRSAQQTEMAEAVEKLATAEAMCAFEGAVIAAEQAAAQAPPELAEEAAAAGARGYRSLITSVVKESVPGIKPIEVVGYVGITRPKRTLGSHT